MSSAETLRALADRYWNFRRDEFPIGAVFTDTPPDSDELMREAPEDHARRAAWAKQVLPELDAIDLDQLTPAQRASHGLMRRELASLVELFECRGHLRMTIYPLGPDFMLSYWASSTSLSSVADAERYMARLGTIPAALDGIRQSLSLGVEQGIRYPRLVVERAVGIARASAQGAIEASPYLAPLARLGGRGEAFAGIADRGRTLVETVVIPAFAGYAEFLETALLPAATEELACARDSEGEAFYRHLIREYTTVDMSAEEIHRLGLSEVERINREMLEVAAWAGFTDDLAGFRRRLQTDNTQIVESADALREAIEILSKRIDARMPEFFGRLPRTTYGVQSIPEQVSAAMPPAYAQPNPADGSAAGVHWITSLPAKLPRYMHLPIALHEAWPGHLMHLALIQEDEQLPAFRRHGAMSYSACLEGWALYCERLGEDLGFYDTPEKRYGRLEMEMWRAVRLVVDTGIHSRGWSRDEAIDFFNRNMAMPMETVVAEVDRYIGLPAQALAYQIGNLKICELRSRAEAELGDKFDIRSFHDTLISPGAVTLGILEETIDNWIASRQAEPA